ncbi:hypothetical protein RQP46_007811 [Phenoliferia psychrophenolica]
MLSTSLGRFCAYPLLALSWCCAVAELGISAALCAKFEMHFPKDALRHRTILLCFGATWVTIFGLVVMIGAPIAPRTFDVGTTFVTFFIAFLIFVVGSSSISRSMPSCSELEGECSMFKALEGMGWVVTWLVFFLILVLGRIYVKQAAQREAEEIRRRKEQA